jgi:hypothetical protein
MARSCQKILELLKGELEFLESGGFRHCPRSPWCAPHNFAESSICPSFSELAGPHPCQECWLMQFIAPDLRGEEIPCRFVQLTASGATVDSLCRYNTPAQTEETLRCWLQHRIHELELEARKSRNWLGES